MWEQIERWRSDGIRVYHQLNNLLRGAPACVAAAYNNFQQVRAAQAAAGIAYYALFSMFPLMLLFISAGSYFLERQQAEQVLIYVIGQALPVPIDSLQENLDHALSAGGTLGLTGLIGLLWSATGVFSALAININRAWSNARERNFFAHRLTGMAMIVFLAILLLASLTFTGLLNLLIRFRGTWDLTISVWEADLWKLISLTVSLALVFLMFTTMYRFVPSIRASRRAIFWGSLTTTALSYLATQIFSWYLNYGPASYELIYGSLWTIVALMFLFYILAAITLYGAHLTAALDHVKKPPAASNGSNDCE